MSINSLTQAQRLDLPYGTHITLVEIELETTTLRFSDRDFRYTYGTSELLYHSYLAEIPQIDEQLDIGADSIWNSSVRLSVKNDPWGEYPYLISLNDDETFERAPVSIYELRLLSDTETFASDVRTLLWKGAIEKPVGITEKSFVLQCSGRVYSKRNALGLLKITKARYPYADPNDIGKYSNIIYGSHEFVPCKCVFSGAIDLLLSNVTATATTVPLSGIAPISFTPSGTIQIDDEQITYMGRTITGGKIVALTGCTRAAGSTKATVHTHGTPVYQVITQIIYEVSSEPVKSITNIFVDNLRQVSNVTSYTGQTGDQLAGYGSKAVLKFSVRPVIQKQINLAVTTEHAHYTNKGSHVHASTSIANIDKRGVNVYSLQNCANPARGIDGNESTAANLSSQTGQSWVNYNLESGNYGVVAKIEINVKATVNGTPAKIYYDGAYINEIAPGGSGWFKFTASGQFPWNSFVGVVREAGSNSTLLYEIFVKFYYRTSISASPATGVMTTVTGQTIVDGLSVADVIVGGEVTCDCDGIQDDGSGTYTGTPNALIERPDHVMQHILISRLGNTSGDIGSTFTTAGTDFFRSGYKFAFLLHDVATEAGKLLGSLGRQCNSVLYESRGKFELRVLQNSVPATSNFNFDEYDIVGQPSFEFTGSDEIKNKISAYYRRDYRANQPSGSIVGIPADAKARGYMDMLNASHGDGDLEEDQDLDAVRTSPMASKVLSFWLGWKRSQQLLITFYAQWRAKNAALGKVILAPDTVFGDKTVLITGFSPQANGTVEIKGIMITGLLDNAISDGMGGYLLDENGDYVTDSGPLPPTQPA